MSDTPQLPTGTVTFLFTDIEGSTRLLQALGDESFRACLRTHDEILHRAVTDGIVVKTIGDAFFVVFTDAARALAAAVAAQRELSAATWREGEEVRVRMGIHTGQGILGGADYVGLDVHRAARIADAGHGGQILLSETTAAAVRDVLPDGIGLQNLGSFHLKDLSRPEPLYQVVVDGLASTFPALRTTDAVEGNLPLQLTSFVGREAELAAVSDLLSSHRIVTLTGPGGTGKTRLSVHVARAAADAFPHGAFFVPLESITDPELVPAAILDALDLRSTSASPIERLEHHLARKTTLLVLDNLEQVLPAGRVISRLLTGAPGVKVLATSRAPLHISGEREFRVPPLALPAVGGRVPEVAASPGVELFAERAQAVDPSFRITEGNAAAVAELVARLDGLPLAIELAASRISHLDPHSMLERLGNRLLAARAPDLPARQQTMTNAIAWSYELLDGSARTLFERCSAFAGGAHLSDIEEVCDLGDAAGFVLDDLAELVDHSLVVMGTDGIEPRYRMLVVVREFARDRLAEADRGDEVVERHARRFASLAEEAAPHLLTSRQREWLDRLSVEHDNLRAALEWAVAHDDGALAQSMAGNLWRFWQARGHLDEAAVLIDRALALECEDPLARAAALEAKGGVAYWQGDWSGALEPYEEALRLVRDTGDAAALANALYNVSFPTGYSGDRRLAREYLGESLRIAQEAGDRLGVGRAYWGLCDLSMFDGDHAETIRMADLAVEDFEDLDAPFDLGWARFMTAQAHYYLGHLDEAADQIERGLPLFVGARDVSAIVLFLYLKAAVAASRGDESVAATTLGVVEGLKERSGAGIADVAVNQYEPVLRLLSDARPEIVEALEAGRRMSDEEAIAFAASG